MDVGASGKELTDREDRGDALWGESGLSLIRVAEGASSGSAVFVHSFQSSSMEGNLKHVTFVGQIEEYSHGLLCLEGGRSNE